MPGPQQSFRTSRLSVERIIRIKSGQNALPGRQTRQKFQIDGAVIIFFSGIFDGRISSIFYAYLTPLSY
ncbi:hypothetical protein E2L00_17825 [Cedecea colo]|uniref:Uncharacterized protein n=1 Tax=Cedecea colo TaxID=2552946 RepID=A0ABX0VQH5_9ENTR|nr:hypothetical protein [Cedecea colo]